jgi:PAS domain S-box-containing protein
MPSPVLSHGPPDADSAARSRLLSDVSESLLRSGLDVRAVMQSIASRTAELVGDVCWITVRARAKEQFSAGAAHHADPGVQRRLQAALNGCDGDDLVQAGVTNVVRVPLQLREGLVGALMVGRDHTSAPFTADDELLAYQVADRAVAVLNNALLYQAANQDRERLRRVVDEREEELRLLSETLPQLVWTAGANGTPSYFNRRWTDYTGYTEEQMRGQSWRRVMHPDDVRGVVTHWRQAVRRGDAYETEYRLRRASDGDHRWHLGRALPLRDSSGRVVKWFGTCTDIHDQKCVHEELRRAVKLRENFISVASHELRTPLTALRLMSNSLGRRAKSIVPAATWVLEHGTKIEGQVNRLIRLVENLLDVSRLSAGRIALDLAEVDLAAVTRDVVERLREEAAMLGCTLSVEATEPAVGRWDAMRVEQVVTNVIGNALKYGARHPVEVSVFREGEVAGIRVRDHGIGIASDEQGRIFGRFERIAAVQHYGGFGLGLWIAREIVEAMSGSIAVESTPGEGAAFTVRLPLRA